MKITSIALYALIFCNSVADNAYHYSAFEKTYGAPVAHYDGAYWFKGKGQLYNTNIDYLFVSDNPSWIFAGVVLTESPVNMLKKIESSRLYPTRFHNTGYEWLGIDGRKMQWHQGKNAKLLCGATFKQLY